jgi:cyclopropane-fatty-acyl-phospholipid synthase
MATGTEAVETQIASNLSDVFRDYQGPAFSIRRWDGWQWDFDGTGTDSACTIVFRTARGLEALILYPSEITLGEAFLSNDIDVEGDLFSAFNIAEHVFHGRTGQRQRIVEGMFGLLAAVRDFWRNGHVHSPNRDKAAISYHYDQPVGFYRPWLGESMAYSCAYFSSPADSLDTAQTRKLDLICRKLRLAPCDHFLDIGCGWGSLILHAASKYGVRAHGITISHEQEAVAKERIEQAQMTQSYTVELLDYRSAPVRLPSFSRIASVGMFEHVGLKNLPLYFRTVHSMLTPGGVFLNHGIVRLNCTKRDSLLDKTMVPFLRDVLQIRQPRSTSFIDKYVFPDGELVTLAEVLKAAESARFEVRDVESLREHYELTLRRWVADIQRNAGEILKQVSESTYRTWLWYMAGCAAAFRRGDIGIYQILLSKPDCGDSRIPLTREDWYSTNSAPAD